MRTRARGTGQCAPPCAGGRDGCGAGEFSPAPVWFDGLVVLRWSTFWYSGFCGLGIELSWSAFRKAVGGWLLPCCLPWSRWLAACRLRGSGMCAITAALR